MERSYWSHPVQDSSESYPLNRHRWVELRLVPYTRKNIFFWDIFIQLISARPDLSIPEVEIGRQSRVSKDLPSHNATQGLYVSSFRHCDVGGFTISPWIFIHNINEAGSVREGLSGKVISKIDAVVLVEERCAVGYTWPTRDDSGMEEVGDISTHPSSSQLQERFRVPCVFRITGWGVQRLATAEISGAMDIPPIPIMEALSRAADKSKVLLTSFLKLPLVKYFLFALEVGLVFGRTFILSHKNNGLMTPPPVYILRYENSFRLDR